MKLLVINGPNLNLLGLREPAHYGTENYTQLIEKIQAHCAEKQIEVTCYQSNHEGDLVDRVQQAYFEGMDGIVINPGAYTHTSIAILDAVKAVRIPTAETGRVLMRPKRETGRRKRRKADLAENIRRKQFFQR